jgi:predicted phage terminase large subunit-like protein
MAQESLIGFTRYTKPDYQPAGHHKLIAEALERVERGECKRLMIFMPPRHGKSELASRRFPAWFLGRNPDRSIIAASYNSELATDFGREVRDIVGSKLYANVFDARLSENSQAAGRWHTSGRGGYVAAGVGTAVTGRGAHVLLIDDPFKDRVEADSETTREKVWRWYTSTAYTRLEGDVAASVVDDDDIWQDFQREIVAGEAEPFEGAIVLIMCMTGDTPVLMATGVEKPLRDVRPGDRVATYENGRLSESTVRNWINQGPDRVFEIRMKSGITVRANARHPFLVDEDGEQKWQRTDSLKKGSVILRAIGGNGRAPTATLQDATSQPSVRAYACRTTTKPVGAMGFDLLRSTLGRVVTRTYAIATGLALRTMSACLPSKVAYAQSASFPQATRTHARTGTTNFASITATIARLFAAFSAMTATSRSDTEKQRRSCAQPLSTFEITRDVVVEVVDAGVEDVFDVQIDRTENFIANGLVSHNTRWNEDDLAGRLIAAQAKGGDQWEKLDLPALSEDGKALWPEKYSAERLGRIKAAIGPRDWTALYQQRPAPEEGTFFQRGWFKRHARKPDVYNVYITSDYAVTEGGGDYTEHAVWGLDPDNRLFMLDWWHGQTSSDVWIERLLDLIERWKPLCCFGEKGVIEKAVRPQLDRRMMERRVYCRMEWLPSIADKPTRARSFQSRAAMGLVSLPETEDGERVLSQLLTFPAGKHDDAVDVCSLMGAAIDQAHSGIAAVVNERTGSRNGYAPVRESGGSSWRV